MQFPLVLSNSDTSTHILIGGVDFRDKLCKLEKLNYVTSSAAKLCRSSIMGDKYTQWKKACSVWHKLVIVLKKCVLKFYLTGVAGLVGQSSTNPGVGGLTPGSPDSWPHIKVYLNPKVQKNFLKGVNKYHLLMKLTLPKKY